MNGSFQEANQHLDQEMNEFISTNKERIFNELNFKIQESEVQSAISALKSGKAAGKDLILNEMIKTGSSQLLPILTKLFNQLLTSGTFPQPWRFNSLTPLYKKGDRHSPENYRGIAVCSNISKLFCSVLQKRLVKYLDHENIIPPNQIGYKKKSRTSDHILTLKALIDKFINKLPRQYLFGCFVDFKLPLTAFPGKPSSISWFVQVSGGISPISL